MSAEKVTNLGQRGEITAPTRRGRINRRGLAAAGGLAAASIVTAACAPQSGEQPAADQLTPINTPPLHVTVDANGVHVDVTGDGIPDGKLGPLPVDMTHIPTMTTSAALYKGQLILDIDGNTTPDGTFIPDGGAAIPGATPDATATKDSDTTEVKVTTAEQAAATFGTDAYSRDASHWTVHKFDDAIGFSLDVDGSGITHRLQNLTGTVYEGYVDVKDNGDSFFFGDHNVHAVTVVANGSVVPEMDLRGGTVWVPTSAVSTDELNARALHLLDQVTTKEHGPVAQGGQPGVLIIPLGFRPESCDTNSTEVHVTTAQQAADTFGTDDYTHNPAHWEVAYSDGDIAGLHLIPDSSGLTHRLNNLGGTFYEGYVDVKDNGDSLFFGDNDVHAVTVVANGSVVPSMDLRGGTVWIPKHAISANELNARTIHLLDQVTTKEHGPVAQGGQPGVLIIPLGFNPQRSNVC